MYTFQNHDTILFSLQQSVFDLLTVNLNIEPAFIRDEIALNWKYETGFVDNINAIVNEFKEARKLKVLFLIIHNFFLLLDNFFYYT